MTTHRTGMGAPGGSVPIRTHWEQEARAVGIHDEVITDLSTEELQTTVDMVRWFRGGAAEPMAYERCDGFGKWSSDPYERGMERWHRD